MGDDEAHAALAVGIGLDPRAPLQGDEGEAMDIHRPKAAHSWREFLIEIGTIVCGILIALGLEQGLESLHERRLAAEAREAVRAEIDLDIANVARFRNPQQACIDARLRSIAAVLAAAAAHRPYRPLSYIGVPLLGGIYTERWDAATAGGRTSMFSSDEQRDYARVYGQLKFATQSYQTASHGWTNLLALEGQTRMSNEQIARGLEALAEARVANDNIRVNLRSATVFAGHIGIRGEAIPLDPVPLPKTFPVCRSSDLSAEAMAASDVDVFGHD